ncbi:hypothetical protein FWF74_01685 [Candidatus Saccharibacteria bacterium]|nr:hypothetical protein [Candidatus Saccharibacteria bacterium]MCL1963387.1 hypothetical protein [Candidatus Saccharibacteria bacterium]
MNWLKFFITAGSVDADDMGIPRIDGNKLLNNALNLIYLVCGIIAVIAIILAGYRYATSAGNPESMKKATQTIIWSSIGLAVVTLAWTITYFLLGRFVV